MSEYSTLKFSRDIVIESSYDVALIRLNTFSHVVGQPLMVRYYDPWGKVKTLMAVGILDGPGQDHYYIVSNGDIEPVTGIYNTDRIPDISKLVNNEIYICYDPDTEKPSYCTVSGGTNKKFTPIDDDRTFYSAMDGFLWFVSNGKIRRSDAPIDRDILASLFQDLIDNGGVIISPVSVETVVKTGIEIAKIDGKSIYAPNQSVSVTSEFDSSNGVKIGSIGGTDIYAPNANDYEEPTITITPTETIGGAKADVELKDKTSLEILQTILCPYKAPTITMSTTKSVLLYGKTYTDFKITATATAGKGQTLKSMVLENVSTSEIGKTTATREKTISTLFPNDSKVTSLTYNSAVTDDTGKTVNKSINVQLVGGIFIFFSSLDALPVGMELDFSTYNCQGEVLDPKGTYNVSSPGGQWLYVVMPASMKLDDLQSTGIDVPVIQLESTISLKQGTNGGTFVSVPMQVWRTDEPKNKPIAGTHRFDINKKPK